MGTRKRFCIMDISNDLNGFKITPEMVEKSKYSFIGAPVIFNKRGEFTNYINNKKGYWNLQKIGFIEGNLIIVCNKVYADVLLLDEHYGKWAGEDTFSNWIIDNIKEDKFEFISMEIY